MAGCLNFSLVNLQERKLVKSFHEAGLENRSIDVGDGATIFCWVPKNLTAALEQEKLHGAAGKPVLVFIQGFGPKAVWQWEPQVKAFYSKFTLIVPDLLFFGDSTTTGPQRSETFQAECVWRVLFSLGIKKFSVVGTSYGGFVAYRLAQAHGEAVEKLVLSSSSVLFTPEDQRELCKRGNAATIPDLLLPLTRADLEASSNLAFIKPVIPWYIPNFFVNDVIRKLYLPNRTQKAELLRDLVIGTDAAPAIMTKVEMDVLIIWGDGDKIFLLEEAERIHKYLGEERAQLVVLENSGHAPQVDYPDKYNSILLKFLLGMDKE